MGSCLRCNAASRPTEGALGLLYWPVIQGHWERSCFISVLQFYWTKWFLSPLDRFASGLLYQSMFFRFLNSCVKLCDLCVETGDFLNCEGSGLFLLQSSCKWHQCSAVTLAALDLFPFNASVVSVGNHSCIPNSEVSFPNNNFFLQLNALSDISPGEVSWRIWVWTG